MARRFNPPPGWPTPPTGWTPGPGWAPDPSWPLAPRGWQLWVDDDKPPVRRPQRSPAIRLLVAIVLACIFGLGVLLAVVAFATGEPGIALMFLGLLLLPAAVLALAAGGVRLPGLRSRRRGGVAVAAAVAFIVVGGSLVEPVADTSPAESVAAAAVDADGALEAPPTAESDPPASSATPSETPSTASAPTPTQDLTERALEEAEDGTALALLATLTVKGRGPKTGYDRDDFGQEWADVDRNGCDTRNDILRRDIEDAEIRDRTNGCEVIAGTLIDPYTGNSTTFLTGIDSNGDVHVDHVVALSDAWQKGAQQWDAATREAFANDPLNLLAVDASTNSVKGDGDAATWLPPQRSYRCEYVARQIGVKAAYGAWVTSAERDAMVRVLGDCPSRLVPTAAVVVTPDRVNDPEPEPVVVPEPVAPEPEPEVESSGDPMFDSCAALHRAGYRGEYVAGIDHEYDWYRDADGDGIVCEN